MLRASFTSAYRAINVAGKAPFVANAMVVPMRARRTTEGTIPQPDTTGGNAPTTRRALVHSRDTAGPPAAHVRPKAPCQPPSSGFAHQHPGLAHQRPTTGLVRHRPPASVLAGGASALAS